MESTYDVMWYPVGDITDSETLPPTEYSIFPFNKCLISNTAMGDVWIGVPKSYSMGLGTKRKWSSTNQKWPQSSTSFFVKSDPMQLSDNG